MDPPEHARKQTPATAASGCPQTPSAAMRLGVRAAALGGRPRRLLARSAAEAALRV